MAMRLNYNVTFKHQEDGSFIPSVSISSKTLEDKLKIYLINYWRWITEGKPPYQYHSDDGIRCQYYYDPYHSAIEWIPDPEEQKKEFKRGNYSTYRDMSKGTYRYSLQLSDSPEGDEWVSGEFKFLPHGDIKIISEKYSMR